MLLSSQATYAVEVSKVHNPAKQMVTMSKADTLDMLKEAGIEPSKIKMLDNGEMVQTEGQYGWWGAIAGAAGGAYGYLGYSMGNHSFSWLGLGATMAGGAVRGFATPTPTAVTYAISSHAAMAGGAVATNHSVLNPLA